MNYEQLYQNIENTQKNICQIAISQKGKLVYSDTWNGYTKYDTVHIASATKSVMALLIGIAVDKGYIESMDQYILEFFPEYQLKRGEKTLQQVQLKHLMTMTAPYKFKSEPWTKVCMSDDWAKSALDLIGGRTGITGQFHYSTLGIQVLSEIIARVSHISTLEFVNEFLFEPLHIDTRKALFVKNKDEHISFVTDTKPQGKYWFCDTKGNVAAGFGLCLSAEEMMKIGQLCMNHGRFEDKQIVSEQWLQCMLMPYVEAGEKYHDMEYGYLWWIINHEKQIYSAIGDSGNVIYLDMSNELVVAVASTFKPAVFDRIDFIQNSILPYMKI